jgi:hypothetical protein
MLKLAAKENSKKDWILYQVDENNKLVRPVIVELECTSPSKTKFKHVKEIIGDLCSIDWFEDWFVKLIDDYIESSRNAEIIQNNIPMFLKAAEEFVESKNIKFKNFSKPEKSSKTSIMFLPEEIEKLAVVSTALKLYSLFWFDSKLNLPENEHKEAYRKLVQPCVDMGTVEKIFNLIRTRVYISNITDRYMWELIKMFTQEVPESHIMSIFIFLMQSMIHNLNIEKNPVPFLIKIIDDSVRYMMRSVITEKFFYGESFGGSEDIYGSSVSKESFHVFCCNDVLSKAANAGMKILEENPKLSESEFIKIKDRLDDLSSLYPSLKLVSLPIISKVLEIPYKFLLTSPPKHTVLASLFMYFLSSDILDKEHPIITEFLAATPKREANLYSTNSSYKLRSIKQIINDPIPIFGFKSKPIKCDIMSSICGVLTTSKRNLNNLIDGHDLSKWTFKELENQMIKFFTKFYSNALDDKFLLMREKADEYF